MTAERTESSLLIRPTCLRIVIARWTPHPNFSYLRFVRHRFTFSHKIIKIKLIIKTTIKNMIGSKTKCKFQIGKMSSLKNIQIVNNFIVYFNFIFILSCILFPHDHRLRNQIPSPARSFFYLTNYPSPR